MKKHFFRNSATIAIIVFIAFFLLLTTDVANAQNDSEILLDEFEVTENTYNALYRDNPDYETIESKQYYKYLSRTKSTTTSGYDSLNGWTKYDTKTTTSTSGYKVGTPISSSTSYANNKKTVKSATDKGWYYYAYTVANPSKTSDWTYYAAKSRADVISHMKKNFSKSSTWGEGRLRYFWYVSSSDLGAISGRFNKKINYCEDSGVSKGTLSSSGTHLYDLSLYRHSQCYKEKTVTTTYYYYKWNPWVEWADWSPTRYNVPSDGSMMEQSEKRYTVKAKKKTTPISDCNLEIIGSDVFEYDGDPKRISFRITHGDEELQLGEDYTFEDYEAVNAGSYELTINGVNDYSGQIVKTFVINKATPIVSFEKDSYILRAGSKSVPNPISGQWDGFLTYSSSDDSVASVDQEGVVTAHKNGNAQIIAEISEGKNFKSTIIKYQIITATPLDECVFKVEKNSFIYDGKSKNLMFTIEDNGYVLQEGKDYTVEGNSAIEVGRHEVLVRGKGNYDSEKALILDISRANSLLSFEKPVLVKSLDAEEFTNRLTSVTDGQIVFSSGNTAIASVNDSGRVSIVGTGTTTITARIINAKNYKNGSASYSLTIEEPDKSVAFEDLRYEFINNRSSFGYGSPYYIGSNIYRYMFGDTLGDTMYLNTKRLKSPWSGNCAGMSATSALLVDSDNNINVSNFNTGAKRVYDLKLHYKNSDNLSLLEFIEAMQVGQNASLFQTSLRQFKVITGANNSKRLDVLFEIVEEQTKGGTPVLIAVSPGRGGHALLAYRTENNNGTAKICVYDSNDPSKEHFVLLTKDESGNCHTWSYDMKSNGIWGEEDGDWISLVPYGVIQTIWEEKGSELQRNYNMLSTEAQNIEVCDKNGNKIATLRDGKLTQCSETVVEHNDELDMVGESSDYITLSMPVGEYTVTNQDAKATEIEIEMANSKVASRVVTTAKEISMSVDDEENLNKVSIEASKRDKYNITMDSSLPEDSGTIAIEGKGSGKTLEISRSNGEINIDSCQVMSVSSEAGDLPKTNKMIATTKGKGRISPSGTENVVYGTDRIYTITPDKNHMIKDVLVDGKSVGAVATYTFENIREPHTIAVIFESSVGFKKIDNPITASNVKLTEASKARNITLKASVVGKTTLAYRSNCSGVKVSQKGVVTITKGFVGRAYITITSKGTEHFKTSTKKVAVTVIPAKVTQVKAVAQKGKKARVTWKKKSNITGYELQYSTSSKFNKARIINLKSQTKASYVLQKLASKKAYYIRIRSYKNCSGGTIRSDWSTVRKVTVK